jgi:diamine N-acetyltransferase
LWRPYGRFAVNAVLDEARRRGEKTATVLWVPGEHGELVGKITL